MSGLAISPVLFAFALLLILSSPALHLRLVLPQSPSPNFCSVSSAALTRLVQPKSCSCSCSVASPVILPTSLVTRPPRELPLCLLPPSLLVLGLDPFHALTSLHLSVPLASFRSIILPCELHLTCPTCLVCPSLLPDLFDSYPTGTTCILSTLHFSCYHLCFHSIQSLHFYSSP